MKDSGTIAPLVFVGSQVLTKCLHVAAVVACEHAPLRTAYGREAKVAYLVGRPVDAQRVVALATVVTRVPHPAHKRVSFTFDQLRGSPCERHDVECVSAFCWIRDDSEIENLVHMLKEDVTPASNRIVVASPQIPFRFAVLLTAEGAPA